MNADSSQYAKEESEPISFLDPRFWAGAIILAVVYMGGTIGWGVVTALVVNANFEEVLTQSITQKAWMIGLMMGIVILPLYRIGSKIQRRVENIRRSS